MKIFINNILTVICSFVCMVICLGCIMSIANKIQSARYDPPEEMNMVVLDIQAEAIDSPYLGANQDDYNYYQLKVAVENRANYNNAGNYINFRYSGIDDNYYHIREEYNNISEVVDRGTYIPAGKKGVVYRTIAVDKNCSEIEIQPYYGEKTEEAIRVPLG